MNDWKDLERLVLREAAALARDHRDLYALQHNAGSGDRGIDLLVVAKAPFFLFGLQFPMRGKSEIRVAFQCKMVGEDHVSLEKLMHSAEQARQQGISDYVLITNKAVTPRTHHTVASSLREVGVRFEVVEGWRVAAARQAKVGEDAEGALFYGSYQFSRDPGSGNPLVDVIIYVRNPTPHTMDSSLRLQSDHNWRVSDQRIEATLGPFESASWMVQFRQSHQDGTSDLVLTCEVGDESADIVLPGRLVEFEFVPRFFGEAHHSLVGELVAAIDDYMHGKIVFVKGAAGCGKSRIIEEAYRRRASDDIRFLLLGQDQRVRTDTLCQRIAELGDTAAADTLEEALRSLADPVLQTVLILDDLHNATSEVVSFTKSLVTGSVPVPEGVCVIACGRDDESFVNAEYLLLLDVVDRKQRPELQALHVPPFSDADARRFIRATIRDLPRVAADLIFRIGQNNPFNIIQTFEHLLDRSIARIVSSQVIGIVNVAEFEAAEILPHEIEDILRFRLDALRAASSGDAGAEPLVAASYLGLRIPRWFFTVGFPERVRGTIELDLFRRGLIAEQFDGSLAFAHENIHLFLRRQFHGDARARCANLLLDWDRHIGFLSDLQHGELLLWAGNAAAAAPYLEPALLAVERLENASAATLDPQYLRITDTLLEFGRVTRIPLGRLGKLLKAKIYLALHNGSPHLAIRACDEALRCLPNFLKDPKEHRALSNLLHQYKGHALINAGRLLPAYAIMRELETSERLDKDVGSLELQFDLFHRLYDVHMKWNHATLAANYIARAENVVNALTSASRATEQSYGSLRCLLEESAARLHLLSDPARARELMRHAIQRSRRDAPERNNMHNELTLVVSEIYTNRHDAGRLAKLVPLVQSYLDRALDKNFLGSIPRSYLVLGTLMLLCGDHQRGSASIVDKVADAGINVSLRRGYLTYVWMLYNLKALVLLRQGDAPAHVNASFETMFRYMKRQDLLFLGRLDNCYPNVLALSNYFRWRLESKRSERDVARGLESLSAYEQEALFNPDNPLARIDNLRKRHSLWRDWPDKDLDAGPAFDASTGYWLAVF